MCTREQRGYQMFPVLNGARVETALPQVARWLPCPVCRWDFARYRRASA